MESDDPSTRLRKARELAGYETAADFAQKNQLPETTYRSHENGNRKLTMEAAKQYAAILGNVTWLELLGERPVGGSPQLNVSERGRLKPAKKASSAVFDKPVTNVSGDMLKVLGMAEGGPDGWAPFNGETVEIIRRPDNLLGVPNGYGVYLSGTSMLPKYKPGDTLHVHPGKPIRAGDHVLVQRKPRHEGDAPLAVVKIFVRRTATKLVLGQYNPPKQIEVPADEVVSTHRIVGSSEA